MTPTRRSVLAAGAGALILPAPALAAPDPRTVEWADLIPPGIPYPEIAADGELDEQADTWAPVFDENATKLNEALDGARVRIPGYVIPLEQDADGVTEFMLVPYVGACIHVPPPPPNQLVLVTTQKPWPEDSLWDPVWVTGTMRTALQSTDIAQAGYALRAEAMEIYEWD